MGDHERLVAGLVVINIINLTFCEKTSRLTKELVIKRHAFETAHSIKQLSSCASWLSSRPTPC